MVGKRRAFGPLVTSDRYEEEDGSGANNATAIMSTMITTGIIMDELGMFPDDEALFESSHKPDTFGHKHPYVDVYEVEDYLLFSHDQEAGDMVEEVILDTITEDPKLKIYLAESRKRINHQQNELLIRNGHYPSIMRKYGQGKDGYSPRAYSVKQFFRINDYYVRGDERRKYRAVPITA